MTMVQLRGLVILTDLLNLAVRRYGALTAHRYLRVLRCQCEIQELRSLRAVELLSDEYTKLEVLK